MPQSSLPVTNRPEHPRFPRRLALQAGALGLVGLGMNHVEALRAAPADESARVHPGSGKARSVIYIFLSGGIGQHDSLDMKPEAALDIRGEFQPIDTKTPGVQICEHLPQLAQRSHLWALCRSLSHPVDDHSGGHHIMLTGRTPFPVGFNPNVPMPSDWPSIASVVGALTRPRNNLPPAAVLPERLIHASRRLIPGQFGGTMGPRRDPWFIEASPFTSMGYGAFPDYEFDFTETSKIPYRSTFQAPNLTLPEGFGTTRLSQRIDLLKVIDIQRADLARCAAVEQFDRSRQAAISLLTERSIREAIDVTTASPEVQERYGKNSFGWSLLMARRLVEAGVNLVQVNLGNNETWDLHGNAFPLLKEKLFPPTDKALSALLDDLNESGLLDSTLIVMAGEFGRTPRIFQVPPYKLPGRGHWGAVQTVFFAGGGIRGGTVVGSSDKIGALPASGKQTPENMAATIFHLLGLPDTIAWHDDLGRPHHIYHGEPITSLL